MNGLELSRNYFFNIAEPGLKDQFPELYPRLAVGLVGNGSECFGYDDELSRDHDWGIDFYIWTTDNDKETIPALRGWKNELFEKNPPAHPRSRSEYGARIGVMTCGEFYSGLIGAPEGPRTINEWIRVPEENIAMTVNGDVFFDGAGDFTKTRGYLLKYYPEDIRLKKIAAKCMALAQTGQYNHERVAKRGDSVTLQTVLSRFTDNAIALVFLLNKVYRPYYKWAFRALKDLPILGNEVASLLLHLVEVGGFDDETFSKQRQIIEEMCVLLVNELRAQDLSCSDDRFLAPHGEEVMLRIEDDFLRSLPAQYEI